MLMHNVQIQKHDTNVNVIRGTLEMDSIVYVSELKLKRYNVHKVINIGLYIS